jgi:hypothetical protein
MINYFPKTFDMYGLHDWKAALKYKTVGDQKELKNRKTTQGKKVEQQLMKGELIMTIDQIPKFLT